VTPKPKLVLIEWVDSAQPVSGWHFLDAAPALEAIRCYSVGWLVGENKHTKMLAPNIGNFEGGGSSQGSGFIRIPARSITRLVQLVEK
jgi:hypothetical protein